MRGGFALINAERLDLPTLTAPDHTFWRKRIPKNIQLLFEGAGFRQLISDMRAYVSSSIIPASRVHCLPAQYPLILLRLPQAGMLQWSLIDNEEEQYRSLADSITMTSLAVMKYKARDRLISWPRVQNFSMPDPPHVCLPSSGHFADLSVQDTTPPPSNFFLHVANMFQNIILPAHVASLFPLTPTPFGNLPGTLKRDFQRMLGFRLQQKQKMQPCQRTLPMSFKWSVYTGHTFVEFCYMESFQNFRDTSRILNSSYSFPTPILLHRHIGLIELTELAVLVLHIIGYLNIVLFGCPANQKTRLQRTVESMLLKNHLSVKCSKSSPLGKLERNRLPFLGWNWYLRQNVFRPKPEKLNAALRSVSKVSQISFNKSTVRSTVGKLLWIALECRPLMSILYRTFQYLEEPAKVNGSIQLAMVRELTLLGRLLPFAGIRLNRGYWNRIIFFDASEKAGAVVYRDVPLPYIWELASISFKRGSESSNEKKALSRFVQEKMWRRAFVHKWRRNEHINALEAHTAVLALEWAASFNITGRRLGILSDSMVAIGAFRKGRSSSNLMHLACRQYADL